jgi:hypothetical protein
MKAYPTIPKDIRNDVHIYAFDKLDGNNIRAEWNSKRGFYKFGSRTQLIDENTLPLGKSIPIIREKYEEDLTMVFKENKWRDVICFFEYHGPNSFAGQHAAGEIQTVTLFDVNPYKQGIMEPRDFIKKFKHLDIPNVLFEGRVNSTFVDSVKNSTLSGMTFEGCVCKGVDKNQVIRFKIKSKAWLEKLKLYCNGDMRLFEKLS